MKYSILLIVMSMVSCTGTLSDEQRRRIKESMDQGEIKKISEAQVTEAGFNFGRKVSAIIERQDKLLMNTALIDSLADAYHVEIISLETGNKSLRGVERQLLEAYLSGNVPDDNIQKMGLDSLLYTKPVLKDNQQGSTEFLKAIGIRMTRKQIVLSIKN